jgi:hypothetical protein
MVIWGELTVPAQQAYYGVFAPSICGSGYFVSFFLQDALPAPKPELPWWVCGQLRLLQSPDFLLEGRRDPSSVLPVRFPSSWHSQQALDFLHVLQATWMRC